jgi:hypothetical protein
MKESLVAIFKRQASRISLLLMVFYCSFLAFNFFPVFEEALTNQIESSSLFGDEDLDDSPARHIELGRRQHTQVRYSLRSQFDQRIGRYSFTASSLYPRKKEQTSSLAFLKIKSEKDFPILYSVFRI